MFEKQQNVQRDDLKMLAAYQAYAKIPSSCVVGLGTGSTVKFFIEALGVRFTKDPDFHIKVFVTSKDSYKKAKKYNLPVLPLENLQKVDITADGADWINLKTGDCLKGAGGAAYLEKLVSRKTDYQIIVVDDSKLCDSFIGKKVAIEVEPEKLQEVLATPGFEFFDRNQISDSNNAVVDVVITTDNLKQVHEKLMKISGVIETGIFVNLVDEAIVAYSSLIISSFKFNKDINECT
ncbi:ribose 5-phosphate isomerase A [bacterium]|jgi:ribose 5-phosphate isomerase A|nr:ribose 5-phosphate isomerase A [bacterium]MBT6294023.1 ribose 5-phosphate isomerase A [bacterium]